MPWPSSEEGGGEGEEGGRREGGREGGKGREREGGGREGGSLNFFLTIWYIAGFVLLLDVLLQCPLQILYLVIFQCLQKLSV